MEHQLVIRHTATTEAGMATFLNFAKDNYGSVLHQGTASSETLRCSVILILPSLSDCIVAVQTFKAQFSIKYDMAIT